MEFSAERSQSVSANLWTVVNLWSCSTAVCGDIGWPWLTLAICGCSQSPPGVAGGSAPFTLSTSPLFIPFSPFPTCLEIASIPPSLDQLMLTLNFVFGWSIPTIHVLFLERGLDTDCMLPCFCFHIWFFLNDTEPDGFGFVMCDESVASLLLISLSSVLCSCVVSMVLQFKSCALHFILELRRIWDYYVCCFFCFFFFFGPAEQLMCLPSCHKWSLLT